MEKVADKRRPSLTAALNRSARRFSAAVAPQYSRIEPVLLLQNHCALRITVAQISQVQKAVEQYVLHNQLQFEPIDFKLSTFNGQQVFVARLFPTELVLFDGAKRLLSIIFSDTQEELEGLGIAIAKVRHPVTGIKQWEFVEDDQASAAGGSGRLRVVNSIDEEPSLYTIEQYGGALRLFASHCGCLFASQAWQLQRAGGVIADISPTCGWFWHENSMDAVWTEKTNNEGRLLAIIFALIQMIREAHAPLIHILMEQRTRRNLRS